MNSVQPAVPQRSLLSIGQPPAQRPRLNQYSEASLLGSAPSLPGMPQSAQLHAAHAPPPSQQRSGDPNAPSHPHFDAMPITREVQAALASIPPLPTPHMQIDASPCTRAIARVDPALSEQVAWEVRRLQNELGGLPPMAATANLSDFAAYLVDVILYHQEKMQSQAPTPAQGAHVPMHAPHAAAAPISTLPQAAQTANGWLSAAEAAHRSDVLDGWCINVHDSAAVAALHEGLPFHSHQDGARFRTQEALSEHTDWLAHKAQSDVLGVVAQGWFKPSVEWLQCKPGTDNSGQHEKYVSFFDRQAEASEATQAVDEAAVDHSSSTVPVDPTQTECPLCGEAFRKHFDPAQQKWVYLGAVQVDGVIYDAEAWADEQAAKQRARKRPREEPSQLQPEEATAQSAGPVASNAPEPPPGHVADSPPLPVKPDVEDSDDDLFGGGSPERPEHDGDAVASPSQASVASA